MKIERVFVTGGAGYIGSVTCEELIKRGYEVIVYDNLSTGHRNAVPKEAYFVKGDLKDKKKIIKVFKEKKPQAVIHFAASCLVEESMKKPEKYFENNVVNALHLLNCMVEYRVERVIFSSSCAVFGIPQNLPIREEDPKVPNNIYGETKFIFEQILKWYNKIYGIKVISLRYFNAAGASKDRGEDHKPETHLIPIVLQVALGKREYVEIFGTDYKTSDGTCIRDYIHIIDIAKAHILALESDIDLAFFNMGNGLGYSVKDVIETAQKVTGRVIKRIDGKRRIGDAPILIASSDKIKKELGWKPDYPDLESIIRSAWEWNFKFPNGYD